METKGLANNYLILVPYYSQNIKQIHESKLKYLPRKYNACEDSD